MRKHSWIVLAMVWCALVMGGAPGAAQTNLFISDYYKVTTYSNVAAAESLEPATAPNKLFEIMITPLWPNFQICLWTETSYPEGSADQKGIFAKKAKWEAYGDASGDRLGKGNVKTREGQVGCKSASGFVRASAAAEEDGLIFWFIEYIIRGNKEFLGDFGPAFWLFPFLDAASGEETIRREGLMTPEEFDEMRSRLLHQGAAERARAIAELQR